MTLFTAVRPRLITACLVLALLAGAVSSVHAQREATTPVKSVAIIPPDEQPDLTVNADLQENSGNDTLEVGEESTLSVDVENQGLGPARDIEVWMESRAEPAGLDLESAGTESESGRVLVERIESLEASTSKTLSIPVTAQDTLVGIPARIAVDVREKNGFGLDEPRSLALATETYPAPQLLVAGFNVKNASEQKIQPDTTSELELAVQNGGEGPARGVVARVQVESGGALAPGTNSEVRLGTVAPEASIPLGLAVIAAADADALSLRVTLEAADSPYGTVDKLTLPVAAPDRPPLVDRSVPSTDMRRENAVAVIVGVKSYENASVPDVDYAVRDANTVRKYLVEVFGYRPGNVIYLENPTQSRLNRVFGTAADHRGQLHDYLRTDSTEVFVYYSGHGAPNQAEDGRAYFVPSDGAPTQLQFTGYPVDQLYENLSKTTSGPITVAIDACFSGQSEEGILLDNASPALLNVENPMVGMERGLVLTAGSADQVSSWYPEKKHGLFTYFLLKGLRGEGDQNEDGAITGREMKLYLDEQVPYWARRLHSRNQSPQVMGQGGDRVLVRFSEDAEDEGE